ncbi:drug/metabolite transporter (DMT)-like permease [Spirosoma oryzae]|uniref:Drug/metabolite transporter (DMT)-like permease n=1 Tax=Spirosoma oryzae TaxID=1469603 RepID=A0A2T0SVW0_9BACT|nr:DUF2723 domain-containing protein [Spirosoma oryzae]PRY37554.1 drug/metabolite transporter (DMT)-like permease [Spirosoma oryzae]
MQSFKRLNTLTGWFTFVVALITFAMTVERTASFWDCGEFIACAFKLQVPHPPGAPFFLLTGRIFSLLSLGDLTNVAYWINMVSVTASAATILFLCWTITMLAQKLLGKPESEYTTADTLLVLGSGAVGALAYTFSDTFWYSAVEAEVYGTSSFFTAIVVWAAFRWERVEDPAAANRWLIFIAYLTGLSIGVHLLNLVTLPALALIYYFKKTAKPTFWGGTIAFGIGMVVLGIINSGIIPGLPGMAFVVERFFVNTLGLPFNSGTIAFTVIFIGAVVYGIIWSARQKRVMLNTSLLALAFVLIGYASYMQVLVRADFNPPINENDPSDALNFLSYLRREQYGSRSLLYGPVFTSRPIDSKKGAPVWKKEGNKYVIFDYQPEYVYAPGDEMLFPRVYSSQQNHPQLYRQMLGLAEGQKPTMGDNLKFLFDYQLGHMWWRYLMWNFTGRESDEEGAGYLLPWSTNDGAPDLLVKNKARDNFYMLPFLLGLFGIVFQYFRRRRDFLIVLLLFVFTGIALQVFLNSPPSEPRERDYIYVGSFYFFAIWLGLGVMGIAEGLRQYVKSDTTRNGLVAGLCLLVPLMMGAKSWDNHDRNNRYQSVDFAKNLLNSCAPNAILFTGGDNDTFPLWYVQEVEGFRRDVRVCNLSLLGTEWYIQQMKRKTYESDALPISLTFDNFNKGKNDVIPFYEVPGVKNGIDLKQYISLVQTNSPAIQVPLSTGDLTSVLPSSVLFLPINKAEVDKANFVPAMLKPMIGDTLQWTIGKKDLYKPDLIMLDMIATNNWKRPIYFSSTLANDNYLNLKDHMQLEGYAYRLMPVGVPGASDGYVNSDIMYTNMMKKSFFREFDNPNVYYDETYRTPIISARIAFFRLADQLLREGKKAKALEVINYSLKTIPDKSIPYDQISSNYVRFLFELGEPKRALEIADTMATRADQVLTYAKSGHQFGSANSELYTLQTIIEACKEAKQTAAASKFEAIFQKHINAFG